MNGKRRWRTSKETSGEACECTVTSGVLKEGRNEEWSGCSKGKGNNPATYSICPRHGIDRERFRHGFEHEGPQEENRPE
jgi:hypothetical protein